MYYNTKPRSVPKGVVVVCFHPFGSLVFPQNKHALDFTYVIIFVLKSSKYMNFNSMVFDWLWVGLVAYLLLVMLILF